MWKRPKPTTIISVSVAIAIFFAERGLDMFGMTISFGWAVVLWTISAAFMFLAVLVVFRSYILPFLRTIHVSWGIPSSPAEIQKATATALKFSVKIEEMSERSVIDCAPNIQKRSPRLVVTISFRTNQVIQIASLHLEIDPIDPRDIVEPDPDLAQGFSFPHILYKSETHQFQFQLFPNQAEGEHGLLLKVLAGGQWYTDGPYRIGR